MKHRISNFIGGKSVVPTSNRYLDSYDPSTGEVNSQVPASSEEDLEKAVQAAQEAFVKWSTTTIEERSKWIAKLGDAILENLDEFAEVETIDTGKPISLSKSLDIPRAAKNFHFYSAAILQFSSESHETNRGILNFTLRQPLGVVGCISPWNLPLYLLTWKLAPALASGNTVIAKPSEITPRTAELLANLAQEIDFPAGVLNIVHGTGSVIGSAISKHPKIRAISFTGGTKTGAEIANLSAPTFKRLTLELGGKNPNIIFADCDYGAMLETTVRSSFSNQGQICLSGSRILVEKTLYEKFKKDFVDRTQTLRVGDPLEPTSDLGAVVSEPHMNRILDFIDSARKEGGKILSGGGRVKLKGRCENGWFIEPTIIEGLSPTCRANQEEIFGPVVTLLPFETEAEALALANNVEFGLAATLWTNNLNQAHRVARDLEAGIIWVNCWMVRDLRTPFGGVKQSGMGREGGMEALRFFTEPKNVCIQFDRR